MTSTCACPPPCVHADTTQDKSIPSAESLFYHCGKTSGSKHLTKKKCLIILGFQGFKVHDGGEKDLTSLPTSTRQKGGVEGMEERRKRKREKASVTTEVFWNLKASATPRDTAHLTTVSLLILFKQFHKLGTKHSNVWAWVGAMAQLWKARFTSKCMSLWGLFSYKPPPQWFESHHFFSPSHLTAN